jgi:AcrR family transcriptional regulator
MTKWESKEKRVKDIVNAAVEIFLEKGYEGASMDAIPQRAQISKGGLYHHFSGKDELLFYANEKLSEPVYLFIQDALSNSDAVQGIRTYIRSYIEHWMNHRKELTFFFLTMTKALSCVDMWPIYEDYFNKMELFMKGLFEKGIRDGSFIEHNAKSGAIALLSALDGITVYLIMNRSLNPEEVIGHFEENFVTPLIREK